VRSLGLIFIIILNLLANDGKVLFEKYCVSCHTPFIPILKLKENFLDYNNTLLKLKGPSLNQLSYRLKQRIGDPKGDKDIQRMEVSAFITDYVYKPDKDKSICLSEVLSQFKTMPSLKDKITEEELEEINIFIYDYDEKIIKEKSIKYQGFTEALKQAKKEHKIIMIEAMSKDCHYCKKMQREVMIEKDVKSLLQKDFITVMVDVSKMKLPLGLKAKLTPTFIFIDKDKKVLMNVPGAWDKNNFLLLLKEVKQKDKR